MEVLLPLEFMSLSVWSVLKSPKLTHLSWEALKYEKTLSGARVLRASRLLSMELPRFSLCWLHGKKAMETWHEWAAPEL